MCCNDVPLLIVIFALHLTEDHFFVFYFLGEEKLRCFKGARSSVQKVLLVSCIRSDGHFQFYKAFACFLLHKHILICRVRYELKS